MGCMRVAPLEIPFGSVFRLLSRPRLSVPKPWSMRPHHSHPNLKIGARGVCILTNVICMLIDVDVDGQHGKTFRMGVWAFAPT